MPHCQLLFLQFLLVVSVALAQNWTSDPFIPPAIPLAVKSPYLQTWLPQGTSDNPLHAVSAWPAFRGSRIKSVRILPELPQLFPEADW